MVSSGTVKERKWEDKFQQIREFKNTTGRWPVYDRRAPKNSESMLANFAFTQRKKWREGSLSEKELEKLSSIDFSFEVKTDNWRENFERIRDTLIAKKSVSVANIGQNDYAWIRRHYDDLNEGSLSDEKEEAIRSLKLEEYFPTWDQEYHQLENFKIEHKRLPTRGLNKSLNSWLRSQITGYKNGKLTPGQIFKLEAVGVDLQTRKVLNDADNWKRKLKEYIDASVQKYEGAINKMPTNVYTWVQTQRAVFQGNMANRKPLEDWKIQELNKTGFKWSGDEVREEEWNNNFRILCDALQRQGLNNFSNQDGKTPKIYVWLNNQLKKFRENKLSNGYENRLRNIGFNFSGNGVVNSFDQDWLDLLSKFLDNVSFVEFDERLDYLNMLGNTDINISTFRRAEHHGLQSELFKGGNEFECAFCGSFFPRSLMVAAHIKPRALCSDEERLNYNVIVPACKFGCDELFERGYFSVVNGNIIILKSHPVTPIVEAYLSKLNGRRTPYFQEKRRQFFADHHAYHFHTVSSNHLIE